MRLRAVLAVLGIVLAVIAALTLVSLLLYSLPAFAAHDTSSIAPMDCAVAVVEDTSSLYRAYVDFDCVPAGAYQICVATLDCTVAYGGGPELYRDFAPWQSEPFLLPEPDGLAPGLALLALLARSRARGACRTPGAAG